MKLALDFLGYVVLTVVTMLPIINPLGTAVLLLGIGAHLAEDERNRQIRRACIYMTVILVTFLLLGSLISTRAPLAFIRYAIAVVLGAVALKMLAM